LRAAACVRFEIFLPLWVESGIRGLTVMGGGWHKEFLLGSLSHILRRCSDFSWLPSGLPRGKGPVPKLQPSGARWRCQQLIELVVNLWLCFHWEFRECALPAENVEGNEEWSYAKDSSADSFVTPSSALETETKTGTWLD